MLEYFYQVPLILKRLRSGASSPYIDRFAGKLKDEGYSRWTATRYLRSAVHFGHFLQLRALSVESVDDETLVEFERHQPCTCLYFRGGTTEDCYRGARLFVDYLRELGIVRVPESAQIPLVESFEHWLDHRLGLKRSTQHRYGQGAAALVEAVGDDPAQYNAGNLRDFVLEHSRHHGRGGTASLCTAVRAFLRFLATQGQCQAGLEHSIPTLHGWPESSAPEHLTPTEVELVLASCNETSAIGLRNHAILLFLARLGLRAGDVVGLRLDDMDWPDGSFIVCGKASREVRLPLPQQVGEALLNYLPHRPDANTDKVFVRHKAPLGPLTTASVSMIATAAMERVGVKTKSRGAHLLRHTAATHMLRQGVPLSQIGAVLRHRSQDMTAHYAKVDFDLLQEVVQPWPENPPC